ncbi:MAG: MFS transporter [Deltaproteobacteria bacterium]|nr:MFS transporter [Deltaproteobacteria bacterium]
MAKTKTKKVPVGEQIREMGGAFWIANGTEALERLAFFAVRAVLPLYMFGTDSVLNLSMTEKGIIFGVWALIQCLLPMISGGYTEAYGYRKSLAVAFTLNALGYVLMANIPAIARGSHSLNFWVMMGAACLIGTGTAIFKPAAQGRVAAALNEGNSGLGFGIFYWVVNVGGFIAPMAAAWARGDKANPTWTHLFYGAAIVTVINLVYCMLFFSEPEKKKDEGEDKSSLQVFADTMQQLWRDQPMFRFLLVVSGFWLMFLQVWDLLPNFIDEWVDARDVGATLSSVLGDSAKSFLTADGAAKPEMLINLNGFTIILLVLPLSWFFGRYRMMFSLVLGMVIAMFGFVGAGATPVGHYVALFIILFSLGEIICSPKFSEFVGMSAPPDKKAQYMGYSNMPFAFGWFIGNLASGPLYDKYSSKVELARRYLAEHLGMAEQWASSDKTLPSAAVVDALKARINDTTPEALTETMAGVAQKLDAIPEGLKAADRAKLLEAALEPLRALQGEVSTYQANDLLWNAYDPWIIWLILGAIGLVSVLGMIWMYIRAPREDEEATEPSDG